MTGAVAAATVAGGAASYYGAKQQADARESAARTANAPYRQKQPFLGDLYAQSEQARQETQNLEPLAETQQAWQSQRDLAAALQQQQPGQQVRQFGQDMIAGDYLSPEDNPYLQDTIDAMQQQQTEQFQREVLPDVMGQAAGAGQVGSSRQGVLQANALDDFNQNLGQQTSQMLMNNYEAERQRQMQAPNLIAQGTQLQRQPAQLLQGVAQQREQFRDPFRGLQQEAQLLGVGPNRQVAPEVGQNPGAAGLQGALGGASTAANFADSDLFGSQNAAGGYKPGQFNTVAGSEQQQMLANQQQGFGGFGGFR